DCPRHYCLPKRASVAESNDSTWKRNVRHLRHSLELSNRERSISFKVSDLTCWTHGVSLFRNQDKESPTMQGSPTSASQFQPADDGLLPTGLQFIYILWL